MVEDSSLESGEYLVYMFNAKIDSALLFISGTTVCVLCIVLLLSEACTDLASYHVRPLLLLFGLHVER